MQKNKVQAGLKPGLHSTQRTQCFNIDSQTPLLSQHLAGASLASVGLLRLLCSFLRSLRAYWRRKTAHGPGLTFEQKPKPKQKPNQNQLAFFRRQPAAVPKENTVARREFQFCCCFSFRRRQRVTIQTAMCRLCVVSPAGSALLLLLQLLTWRFIISVIVVSHWRAGAHQVLVAVDVVYATNRWPELALRAQIVLTTSSYPIVMFDSSLPRQFLTVLR